MSVVVRRQVAGLARSRIRRADVDQLSHENRVVNSPLEEIENAELHGIVRSAVDRLGPVYSETIILRYFESLSHPEIADRLGLPIETVRSRLKRGLRKLRDDLDRERTLGSGRWALVLATFVEEERRLRGSAHGALGASATTAPLTWFWTLGTTATLVALGWIV